MTEDINIDPEFETLDLERLPECEPPPSRAFEACVRAQFGDLSRRYVLNRDDYEHEGEYAAALEREFRREFRQEAHMRFADSLTHVQNDEIERCARRACDVDVWHVPTTLASQSGLDVDAVIERDDDRFVQRCPIHLVRDQIEVALIYQRCGDKLFVRCVGGCTPEQIAAQVPRLIKEYEIAYVADVARRAVVDAVADAVAQCSLASLDAAGEQRWVVDGLLPDAALTLLYGPSGARKTLFGMSLAVAVATDSAWLQQEVIAAGRVLLVLREGSDEDIARRLRGFARAFGVTLAELEGRLLLWRAALHTDDEASMANFARYVAATKPTLIVVDNLSEIFSGTWNDPAAVGRATRPLAQLAHGKLGAPPCAVALITHSNANGGIRGRDGVLQHVDHELQLDSTSDRNDAVVVVTRGKARSGQGVSDLRMRFVDRDGAIVPELVGGQPAAAPVENDRRAQLLALLPRRAEELNTAMADDHGCGRSTTKGIRDQLEAEGVIVRRDDGVWQRAAP